MNKDNILSEGFYTKILKMFIPKSIKKGLDKVGKQESDFQIKYFKYHG